MPPQIVHRHSRTVPSSPPVAIRSLSGREGDREQLPLVPAEEVDERAAGGAPEPRRHRAGGHDPAAVGAEAGVRDDREVAAEDVEQRTAVRVPDRGVVVAARRHDPRAVGRERDRRDVSRVPGRASTVVPSACVTSTILPVDHGPRPPGPCTTATTGGAAGPTSTAGPLRQRDRDTSAASGDAPSTARRPRVKATLRDGRAEARDDREDRLDDGVPGPRRAVEARPSRSRARSR